MVHSGCDRCACIRTAAGVSRLTPRSAGQSRAAVRRPRLRGGLDDQLEYKQESSSMNSELALMWFRAMLARPASRRGKIAMRLLVGLCLLAAVVVALTYSQSRGVRSRGDG